MVKNISKEPVVSPKSEKKLKELEELVAKAKEQYREQIEKAERKEVAEKPPLPKPEISPPKVEEKVGKPPLPAKPEARPPAVEAAPEVSLPLTPTEIEAAQKLPLYRELRWLGEWCLRQLQKLSPSGFNEKIRESLQMVFLEILVPRDNEIEPKAADQMFANFAGLYCGGFLARVCKQHTLSLEIVAEADQIRFIVGTPVDAKDFVIKQIHAAYPPAEIIQIPEYNIFEKEGKVEVAELVTTGPAYYSTLTYEDLPLDPLSSLTHSLSKLKEGDSAAIQICITPAGPRWQQKGEAAIYRSQAPPSETLPAALLSSATKLMLGKPEEPSGGKAPIKVDEKFIEGMRKKISKAGFITTIRIVVTGSDQQVAETHLNGIVSSFEQFSNPRFASFRRKKVFFPKHLMIDFLYRYTPQWFHKMILSSEELATLFHFPNKNVQTPDIKWLLAKSAPPPQNLPTKGLYLGRSTFRGLEEKILIKEDDRRRHIYILGQTGTGKTELLKHLIYQDITAGRGLAFIDPHGDAVRDILEKIPEERIKDVIYFNPGDTQRPPGLNILETETEEGKHLIINSFIALLYKLYDPNRTGIMGPRLERAVRNVMLTAMSEKGNTLVEVLRLLIDPDFARGKLPLIKDPLVKMYWTKELAQTSDFHKSETLGYFVSKFDRFVTERLMRNIIGQSRSSFNFREVMDKSKILLINLSKGKVGEENSNFLGLILIPRILAAAMSRTDIPEEKRRDFYLYVDEFQNFATPDFVQILSEARKYRLNLTVANQFIGQLPEEIKNAVFGNVGTTVCFRVGADDAEYLEKQVEPFFNKADLMSNPLGNNYARLLISGQPSTPFSMKTVWEEIQAIPRNKEQAERIIALSREKYGRDVVEVEEKIKTRAGL